MAEEAICKTEEALQIDVKRKAKEKRKDILI